MKKLLLVTAMVLGLAGMSWAQLTDHKSADIKLQIVAAMTMTVSGTVNFGSYPTLTSGSKSVLPANGALFTVTGTPGASFVVTLPASGSYDLSDGTNTINFTPDIVTSPDGSMAGSSVSDGNSYNFISSGTDAGKYFFLLGGSVDLVGTEAAGVYSGTYTLTAAYN